MRRLPRTTAFDNIFRLVSKKAVMAGLAVEATKRALYYYGPSLLTQDYWEPTKKPNPGWMSRLQAAPGPQKDQIKDPHARGVALDIILFAKKSRRTSIGRTHR
jgi:hypothetical protein